MIQKITSPQYRFKKCGRKFLCRGTPLFTIFFIIIMIKDLMDLKLIKFKKDKYLVSVWDKINIQNVFHYWSISFDLVKSIIES